MTLIGRADLARVVAGSFDLVHTGGSPHDLIVDRDGLIWFSNWDSETLNVYDPGTDTTIEAPAGVIEPHHFALDPAAASGFPITEARRSSAFSARWWRLRWGGSPILAFAAGSLVVAVSSTGEAAVIRQGRVVANAQLTPGLHGVAVVELTSPLAEAAMVEVPDVRSLLLGDASLSRLTVSCARFEELPLVWDPF